MIKKSLKIFKDIIGGDKIYLCKIGPIERSLSFKYKTIYKKKINPYVFANKFISFKWINSDVIINFLENLNKEKKINICAIRKVNMPF